MTNAHFLTLPRVIRGLLIDKLKTVFFFRREIKRCPQKIGEYELVRVLHESYFSQMSTGEYRGPDGRNYVIRHISHMYHDSAYVGIFHEAKILKFMEIYSGNSSSGRTIRFSKPVFISILDKQVVFVKEFVEGKTLASFGDQYQLQIFGECVDFLEQSTEALSMTNRFMLPSRSNIWIFIAFPVYLILAYLRVAISLRQAISLGKVFCIVMRDFSFFSTDYVLAHRDMHAKNIVVNDKEIVLIDAEEALLAEKNTDIAKAMWAYWPTISIEKINSFLMKRLISKRQKITFLALSAFYTVQMLATFPKRTTYFVKVKEYLPAFLSEVAPKISLDEKMNVC